MSLSAADSLYIVPHEAVPAPFDGSIDHALAAAVETEPIDLSLFRSIIAEADAPPAWTQGREPEPRIVHPAGHSVVLGVLALLFVACLMAFSYFGRAITASVQDL